MSKHTPLPWAFGRGTVTQIFAVDLNGEEYCREGGTLDDNHIVSVRGIYGNFAAEAQANAEFIVDACNSHDALVKALRDARDALGECFELTRHDPVLRKQVECRMSAAAKFDLPWEACGNLIRDKRAADGSGGFLMAEVPANLDAPCARAEFIVQACNAHDDLMRIAELVLSAVKHRQDKDWPLMHLDLSEAVELAAGVQP
jgi:hypothetical protein